MHVCVLLCAAVMLAACKGDLETAWMLIDAGADVKAKDKLGATALSMAKDRGFTELVDLLGGGSQEEASRPLMPDDFSSDEEETPEADVGPAVVLDHTAKLTTTLSLFAWEQYECALAKLAGVAPECVFVTPEPGNGTIEAHATIVKKLKSWEITSNEGIDEIMKTVKALRQKEKLMVAAGAGSGAGRGGRVEVVGLPEVKLLGEGADAAEQMRRRINDLVGLREAYHDLKVQHCEARRRGDDPKSMMLAASKAILLMRPARESVADAAAASKAAAEQHRKRVALGSTAGRVMGSTAKGPLSSSNRRIG